MKRSKRAERTKQEEWRFPIFKYVLHQNRKLSKRGGEKTTETRKSANMSASPSCSDTFTVGNGSPGDNTALKL